MPTPEELSRINIDRQFIACGWTIQEMSGLNRYAGPGVALREVLLFREVIAIRHEAMLTPR